MGMYEELYIDNLLQDGDEQRAADVILLSGENSVASLKENYKQFKNERILFDLIINVYTSHGYNFPRSLIVKAKSLAKFIPQSKRLAGLPDGDPVTVWRGCDAIWSGARDYVATDISWTADKRVAIWFANRINQPYSSNGKGGVWEATIPRDKIIAYTDSRGEREIIQHLSVVDPHLLDISCDEWQSAIDSIIREKETSGEKLFSEGIQD